MDTQCNSKTSRDSLPIIIFCMHLKHIGYHMSRAMKSVASCYGLTVVCTMRSHAVLLKRSFLRNNTNWSTFSPFL